MQATYARSISSAAAISGLNSLLCYNRCLWATAELQDSRLRGPSFQLGNQKFLDGRWMDGR